MENDAMEDEMQDMEMDESDYEESEMDEPQYGEPERATHGADINRLLQNKLEKDFGKLPPNIVICGIPEHNSAYSANSGGLER
jgi:hypothetical protein